MNAERQTMVELDWYLDAPSAGRVRDDAHLPLERLHTSAKPLYNQRVRIVCVRGRQRVVLHRRHGNTLLSNERQKGCRTRRPTYRDHMRAFSTASKVLVAARCNRKRSRRLQDEPEKSTRHNSNIEFKSCAEKKALP